MIDCEKLEENHRKSKLTSHRVAGRQGATGQHIKANMAQIGLLKTQNCIC
jgi:hypothetical protein